MEPPDFYNALADEYHLIFADWWSSAQRQGGILSDLLRRNGVRPPGSVLDCTCGIGTQALPLAAQGFRVTGSDLSDDAVARARNEAAARDIDIRLLTADVRSIAEVVDERFDAVISCDNSLPHLLTDDDLARALASIRRCLQPGGVFLASIRDYDALLRDQVGGVVPAMREVHGERRIVGQTWQWAEDRRTVEITLFVLRQQESEWVSTVVSTTYRALLRHEMTSALSSAGFEDIRWLEPETTGYHQPIVTAPAGPASRPE